MGTRDVIEAFWTRHRAHDPAVVDLFADEVDFFAPGDPALFPWAGHRTQGGAALLEAFEAMWTWSKGGGKRSEPLLIVDGDHAAWVALGNPHRPEGLDESEDAVTMDVVVLFTVRDERITRFRVVEDITSLAHAYRLDASG